MEDYPKTLLELEKRFSTEEACLEYLAALRWPEGFLCPSCGTRRGWKMGRGLWLCAGCRRQLSVTAGTVLHRSRLSVVLWFRAMWFVASQKNGTSALGIQRILGLGCYQTAWTWLHKLRRAMVRPGRDRLKGVVEIDESYVGGEEAGVAGRQTETKSIVAIAVEVHSPKGFGRVRLQRIDGVSAAHLSAFVQASVEPGSTVHTDGWGGYNAVAAHGYDHKKTIIAAADTPAHVAMPGVHRVASLLKRWLLGTHQGAVSAKHLDYYLDEFAFRFNRRTSASPGKLFYRLAQQVVQTEPLPYRSIIAKSEVEPS